MPRLGQSVAREDAVKARMSELTVLNEELSHSREELRNLSEHLQRIREEERNRIAREVHDRVGQFLTGLKMNVISQSQNPPQDTAGRLEQSKVMLEQIDDAIHNVQEICSELRPTMLNHFGLGATIQWYLEELAKQTGIRCKANMEPELPPLDKDLDILVFRIVQEVMTNVLRHARATKAAVKLKCEGGNLVLKIKDNGRGILKEEVTNPKSFGIIGIRERVRFQGGHSKFEGIPNKGTTVTILFPLNRTQRAVTQ